MRSSWPSCVINLDSTHPHGRGPVWPISKLECEFRLNKRFLSLCSSQLLVGASVQTYLLEKTRVAFQAPNERNFHIFYQVKATKVLESTKKLLHLLYTFFVLLMYHWDLVMLSNKKKRIRKLKLKIGVLEIIYHLIFTPIPGALHLE